MILKVFRFALLFLYCTALAFTIFGRIYAPKDPSNHFHLFEFALQNQHLTLQSYGHL